MDCGVDKLADASYSSDVVSDTRNFECNICFELAQEPIVTLCGHLYCWPCLYQWLQLHSHSCECPICKAFVQEEKLIPIYGRGDTSYDPRAQPMQRGVTVPRRPIAHRPETAPLVDMNYARPTGLDPMTGLTPMASSRFGHQTWPSLFGAIFNLHVHGFNDATVYGTTSGVPHLFSSFHGGYVHGFHNYHFIQMEWKPVVQRIVFILLGFLIFLHLIFG